MKHYGDITKLNGRKLPTVDVITGGSPCQDLSVAGKREGLAGERSGLFMEQIRIVKEMREHDRSSGRADEFVRPRYMVWENVPGAFSSNGGKDFQAVLTEIVRIADPEAPDVPLPDRGVWSKAGCLYSDVGKWSVAWRVHDSQFWGCAQRRKRIALVADFAGLSAAEICFERKGLRRDSPESEQKREETPGAIGNSTDQASGVPCYGMDNERRRGVDEFVDQAPSITARAGTGGNNIPVVFGISSFASNAMKSGNPYSGIYKADTSRTLDINCGNPACNQGGMIVLEGNGSRPSHKGDGYAESETMYTLNSTEHHAVLASGMTSTKNAIVMDGACPTLTARKENGGDQTGAVCMDVGFWQSYEEKSPTLLARQYKDPPLVCGIADIGEYKEEIAPLRQSGGDADGGSENLCVANSVVRRLTPEECELLQGFPKNWTNIGDWVDSKGKKHKEADSPRYKALGNSIALPFWQYLARRICAQYERDITMGSLFDGIGGFPLVFERCGAKAVWASEIDEFPIAVTKKRFPEGEDK